MGAKPRVQLPPQDLDLDPDLAGSPLEWVDSIHGYLMVFPRTVAETWSGYQRGTSLERDVIVDGVLAHHGEALVLLAAPAARLAADDDAVLVILAGRGPGGDLVAAARGAGDWIDTGAEIDVTGGLVAFDGVAPWAMVSGGLYVAVDAAPGRYRVHHRSLDRVSSSAHALRLEPI